VIILGIILIIVGFLIGIPVIWWIGAVLLVVGLVLTLLGATGHPLGGHKTYY